MEEETYAGYRVLLKINAARFNLQDPQYRVLCVLHPHWWVIRNIYLMPYELAVRRL